ncbi:MAG: DAK2 domain-containing protein, partial [Anaerolineales bacterium]
AEEARQVTNDPLQMLEHLVRAADASVQRPPERLAGLKQAGVVDSGGKGLFFILEGMLRHIKGLPLDTPLVTVQPLSALKLQETMEVIEEGQDFEVVVDFYPFQPIDLQAFYSRLEQMGTSIQVGEGDGMYRMHIHVPLEKRYEPIDYIMGLGTITKVAMENLLAQMSASQGKAERLELANVQPGQIAVVAVSPGRGLSRIFASLGVAAIVEGGQTMNPSTQEILSAFENLPTDKIIILPNNKNIILAANQAREVTVKQVVVIPSCTIPQGLAAMLAHDPDGDLETVAKRMTQAMEHVRSGEITIATRSVELDGVKVEKDQVIALLDGKLVLAAPSLEEALLGLLEKVPAAEYELITLFYGADLPHAEANRLADLVRQRYPQQEVELQEGNQPHYALLVSIE